MSILERGRPNRLPPTFQQLCVIAREQIRQDLTIDDAEWKARIKDRLAELRFAHPEQLDAIERAMRAVETSLTKYGTPRPAPLPPSPSMPHVGPPQQRDGPWRWPRRLPTTGLVSLSEIVRSLINSRGFAPSSPPSLPEDEGDDRKGSGS